MPCPVTPQVLLQHAADVLKVDVSALPAGWSRLAVRAVALGWAELQGAVAARGYDGGQLESTDQAIPWGLSQGLFELGQMGGGFGDYNPDYFKQFDLRERLLKEPMPVLTLAGQGLVPGASTVGGITSGVSTVQAAVEAHRPSIAHRMRDLFR